MRLPLRRPVPAPIDDRNLLFQMRRRIRLVSSVGQGKKAALVRARARKAMRWRSQFLKALAMSDNTSFSLKAASVAYNTYRAHIQNDPDFAAQVREAEERGAYVLEAAAWSRAVEGRLEPVVQGGVVVAYVRKFSDRLLIELLRAHMPDKFKTPGTGSTDIQMNQDNRKLLVWTPEVAAKIQERVRAARMAEKEREQLESPDHFHGTS